MEVVGKINYVSNVCTVKHREIYLSYFALCELVWQECKLNGHSSKC